MAEHANNSTLREQLAELMKKSPDFARFWHQHAALVRRVRAAV